MRWLCLGIGGTLLTGVGLVAVARWDAITDPESQKLRCRQIVPGMKLREVEALMGEKGEPQLCFWCGPVFLRPDEVFNHRWENPYATIDVLFEGPRGAAEVIHINIHVKNPPDFTNIWATRTILLLSALLGFGFIVIGLWPRKPSDSLNSLPTSDKKDGVESPV
jgi:hypothetical protein